MTNENKKSLLEKLREKDPKTHVVFNAIWYLKEIPEMKTFIKEYVDYLEGCGEKFSYPPMEIARQNIMTCLGYCGGINEKWGKAYEEYVEGK